MKLQATSDSGLAVRYYVESGPAVIEGETLQLSDVPKRAVFPIKITVVAYQYGTRRRAVGAERRTSKARGVDYWEVKASASTATPLPTGLAVSGPAEPVQWTIQTVFERIYYMRS